MARIGRPGLSDAQKVELWKRFSPYPTPVPHRGKRCEPACSARTLAACPGEEAADSDAATTTSARSLFGL